mmetsp:Transcript_17750/g.36519  ORF Transcript_17750/g.36519 Transcript_17750/m.36519 type:complete len:89 (-) Transcript_17750:1664-1930(-)
MLGSLSNLEKAVWLRGELFEAMKPAGAAATVLSIVGAPLKRFDGLFVVEKDCRPSCSLEPICEIPGSGDPFLTATLRNTPLVSFRFDR